MLGRWVVVAVGIAFAWFCLVLPGEQVSQCIQGQSRTSATHKSPSKHSVGRDIRNPVGGGVLLIWPIRAPPSTQIARKSQQIHDQTGTFLHFIKFNRNTGSVASFSRLSFKKLPISTSTEKIIELFPSGNSAFQFISFYVRYVS